MRRVLILLIFMSLCMFYKVAHTMQKVKVYSFGATRKRHNHIKDKKEKYLDWNDMHTVRLDHEPIEIPNQFTWCSWYLLDMLPPEGVQGSNILLYAISSSTTNQSMMDASVNKTWDELLRGTRVSLSGLHLWGDKSMQYHHWGSLWANLKPIPPKLKEWRSICVGQDSPHGSVIVYNDGEIADQTVVGEYYSKYLIIMYLNIHSTRKNSKRYPMSLSS